MDFRRDSSSIPIKTLVLNRTRESHSADGRLSSVPGQVLDQTHRNDDRYQEFPNTPSLIVPQAVPVIVRNSTPVPEDTPSHENCANQFFNPLPRHQPTFFAPQDFDFSIRNFIRDLPEDPVSDLNLSSEDAGNLSFESSFQNPLEPSVPWSPLPSNTLDCSIDNQFLSTCQDILTGINLSINKTAMDQAHKECRAKKVQKSGQSL